MATSTSDSGAAAGTSAARPKKRIPRDLEDLLDVLDELSEGDGDLAVADIHDQIGRRSFGPALLAIGVLMATPIGGIPFVPTTLAVMVVLITGQLLIGRRRFWLPDVIRRRAVAKDKFRMAIRASRPAASRIDRFIHPRLSVLIRGPAIYVVAAVCFLTAMMTPPLEVIPFAAAVPALAFAAFGLAITARDGALALAAFVFSGGTLYLVLSQVLLV